MRFKNQMIPINNRDREILIGELRIQAGLAILVFLIFSVIFIILSGIVVLLGEPSQGHIQRLGIIILSIFIITLILFRGIFSVSMDLVVAKKIRVIYDGNDRKITNSKHVFMTEVMTSLIESGSFEKLDLNQSFVVELSRYSKETLYVEQFDKEIFPLSQ